MPDAVLRLTAESVRGYSAYETAVQHGFSGTEAEWLASLHGGSLTVNGVSAGPLGDIALAAENVPSGEETVQSRLDALSAGAAALSAGAEALEAALSGKLDATKLYNGPDCAQAGHALDARQGAAFSAALADKADAEALTALAARVNAKASVKALSLSLPAEGWSAGAQTVSASGVEAASLLIVTPAPADYVAYGAAAVRCSAQSPGALTFTCAETPETTLGVNVLILTAGGN